MKLGNCDVVVLNSYKVIKHALQKQARTFAGRPMFNSFQKISQGRGIVFNSEASLGPKWLKMKMVVIKLLHNFVSSKHSRGILCRHLRTETMHLVKQLCDREDQTGGGEMRLAEDIIQVGVANLVCAIMFGHRYEYSNKVSVRSGFG